MEKKKHTFAKVAQEISYTLWVLFWFCTLCSTVEYILNAIQDSHLIDRLENACRNALSWTASKLRHIARIG